MSTVYGYLDHLIDEKTSNAVEAIWVRFMLIQHSRGRVAFRFLPKKAREIYSQWEDEMKGGDCYGCRETSSINGRM